MNDNSLLDDAVESRLRDELKSMLVEVIEMNQTI